MVGFLRKQCRNFSSGKQVKMLRHDKKWFLVEIFVIISFNLTIDVAARECCPTDTYVQKFSIICSDNATSYDLDCENGAWLLDPMADEDDKFGFDSNGNLLLFNGEKINKNRFCLGKLQRNESEAPENLVALVCFTKEYSQSTFVSILLRLLMIVSVIFLIITFWIYMILSNLRDLQGKCVVAFICALIGSYMTLFVVQTFPDSSQGICIMQAASLYFFMCATFFWNNVITFNIWRAVRNASNKMQNTSKFFFYVAWGFGMPFAMVLISFIMQHVPGENHIRPHFGQTSCWFRGKLESWSYFYGPVSVLLMLNTLMFLHSSWTFWKIYKGLTVSSIRSLRFKCIMYLKLFLLMGISWTFEVISYAMKENQNTKYLWFVTDCLNSSQGLIIFLILVVFRQKVKQGLVNKKIFNINWPKSWREEKMEESTASCPEEMELADGKIKIKDESL